MTLTVRIVHIRAPDLAGASLHHSIVHTLVFEQTGEPTHYARLHQKCRHLRASETNRPILPPPGAPTLLGGVSHRRYQPESSPRGIGFDVGRLALVRRPEEKGIEGEEADEDDATEEDKTEG